MFCLIQVGLRVYMDSFCATIKLFIPVNTIAILRKTVLDAVSTRVSQEKHSIRYTTL